MKTKIPFYILLRAFGITDKKIKYTINKKEDLVNIIPKNYEKTKNCIINISQIILGKKNNLVRIYKVENKNLISSKLNRT